MDKGVIRMNKLAMMIYDGQITKNFNLDEFKCKSGYGEMIINEKVIAHIQRLQKFRDWYNRPMSITSGYRTPIYNKQVGGVSDSQHIYGIAADIILPAEYLKYSSIRKKEFKQNVQIKWNELCKADGLQGGVGWYNQQNFMHLDSREGSGSLVVWYG